MLPSSRIWPEFPEFSRRSSLRARLLQFRLDVRPMVVDDLPLPFEPRIDLGRVPANRRLPSIRQPGGADQVIAQYRYFAMHLHLGIDHFVAVNPECAGQRSQQFRQRCQPVDAFLLGWVEISDLRRIDLEVPVWVARAPAVKR